MANLMLLKNLLPAEYRVIGTPQKVLVISPFKTFFGFIEVSVEDAGKKYVIMNQDIPYQFKLLGFEGVLRRIKDFSTYPVRINEDSLVVEIPHNEKDADLIQLAKTVDGFIKDLYDFVNNLTSIESVKQRLGAVAVASFKLKKLKEKLSTRKWSQVQLSMSLPVITTKTVCLLVNNGSVISMPC